MIKLLYLSIITLLMYNNIAYAEINLKNLELLSIDYGVNELQISDQKIVITRAILPNEVAGQGDVYTVMSKQKNNSWELVQYPDRNFTTSTWSHTGNDAVSTVIFFTSKDSKELYLLKAERAYESSIPSSGIATFNLYKIEENKDFNFMEFKNIDTLTTKTKYCNVKLALNKELGIALPNDYIACVNN